MFYWDNARHEVRGKELNVNKYISWIKASLIGKRWRYVIIWIAGYVTGCHGYVIQTSTSCYNTCCSTLHHLRHLLTMRSNSCRYFVRANIDFWLNQMFWNIHCKLITNNIWFLFSLCNWNVLQQQIYNNRYTNCELLRYNVCLYLVEDTLDRYRERQNNL